MDGFIFRRWKGVAFRLIQKTKQAIEADSGAEKRGIIQTHGYNLLEALSPPSAGSSARDGFRCGFAPGTTPRWPAKNLLQDP